jgi:DNA-binding XRE family transcriptional regulator
MWFKALYQIEKDTGNPTINTLESILRKFGLRLGLTKAAKNLYALPSEQRKTDSGSPIRSANLST